MKYEHMDMRLEIYTNLQWWIMQILRILYRKYNIIHARYEDICKRCQFISVESLLLQNIHNHAKTRLSAKPSGPCHAWLVEHEAYIVKQCIMLDVQQESLLKEELNKISIEVQEMNTYSSLLSELIRSMHANNQLVAEKLYLEVQLYILPIGTDKSIQCNEQLILLKNKQKTLTTHSIDSLKVALRHRCDAFDATSLMYYAFPNDSPDLTVEQLSSIQVVLLDPFSPSVHIYVHQFLKIYLLQPWLLQECIDDIRFEERINNKLVRYKNYQEEYSNIQTNIAQYNQTITRMMTDLKDLETQVRGKCVLCSWFGLT